MGMLRDKMVEAIRLRRFSKKTEQAYVSAVTGLAKYYNKPPDNLNADPINKYLLYLQEEKKLSWSSCNIKACGIKFFYIHVLKREPIFLTIPPRRNERKLPEIFSLGEVKKLLDSAGNMKSRVLLMLTYSAGLRLSEVISLKVGDIDSDRMMIHVVLGKGKKDRYTILSKKLLEELRNYYKIFRPEFWLFPSPRNRDNHISGKVAQAYYNTAKERAGLKKGNGIHTLRHCFATHLLEGNINIRTIQALMGHRNISTTMVYLKVSNKLIGSVQSPFDQLEDSSNAF